MSGLLATVNQSTKIKCGYNLLSLCIIMHYYLLLLFSDPVIMCHNDKCCNNGFSLLHFSTHY